MDWQGYKRQIASDVVDSLTADQDRHISDLTRLCHEVVGMKNFRHLEQLEDGKSKADKARKAVADLKGLVEAHDDYWREELAIQKRRREHAEKLRNSAAVPAKTSANLPKIYEPRDLRNTHQPAAGFRT